MIENFFKKVCNFLNFNSDNSKENNEENFKDVLEILKTEYNLESERTKSIEKKANIFLTLTVAIVSLIVPNIPIKEMKVVLFNIKSDCISLIQLLIQLAIIFSCFLLIAPLIYAILAFYNFTQIVSSKTKNRINYKKIIQEMDNKEFKRALINHYSDILDKNIKYNNDTTEIFHKGEKYFRYFFFTLILGIIIVTLIVK